MQIVKEIAVFTLRSASEPVVQKDRFQWLLQPKRQQQEAIKQEVITQIGWQWDRDLITISWRSHRDLIAIWSACVFIGGHEVEKEHTQQLHDALSCWSHCGLWSEAVSDLCTFYATAKWSLMLYKLPWLYKVVEQLHLHVFGMWKTSIHNWS